MSFDYHEAFSRNLGWVTETEQEVLRNKRIAIAGMGGVGGSHLLTLTRLGIGAFNLADFEKDFCCFPYLPGTDCDAIQHAGSGVNGGDEAVHNLAGFRIGEPEPSRQRIS